jgi:ATP-dependent helicase HrpA
LLKKQLLDPHWEKKGRRGHGAGARHALRPGGLQRPARATSAASTRSAREIFIREALVAGNWDTKLPFLAANQKLVQQVQDLEHKARRQDVLVDEELIYAFYDQQLPADVHSGASCEHWYKEEPQKAAQAAAADPRGADAPRGGRHHHQAFPKTLRMGGVDCAATYLHEPGDARDGVTVDVPLFVLNQVNEERCEWLVPGMLKDKVQALIKTLHQRPRSRLVPLPDTAARMTEQLLQPEVFGSGSLTDAVLKLVRDATSLDVKRNDIKLDMLPPHLFMNFRVVDEHGRQLGAGRNLGALKAELGRAGARGFPGAGRAQEPGPLA